MSDVEAAIEISSMRSTAKILGIGTALPPFAVTQPDACEFAQNAGLTRRYRKALEVLYKQSGVKQRYSVLLERDDVPLMERQSFFPILLNVDSASGVDLQGPTTGDRMQAYRKFAPPLAIRACQQAITESDIDSQSITHLITVSCSGFAAPGVDFELIETLPLSQDVQRTHIGFMGCHASLNALRVARSICESQPGAVVLVCSVELCTIHQQYTDDPQQLVANSLFGDGAAALVLSATNPSQLDSSSDEMIGDSTSSEGWTVVDNASSVIEKTLDTMSWHVSDHGFEMSLSPRVPEIICERLKPWLDAWLERNGLQQHDVQNWIVHPGGPRILSAVTESLALVDHELEHSWKILQNCGNMSSPTVLFILKSMSSQCAKGPTVMLGFGPGLTVEACLLNRN